MELRRIYNFLILASVNLIKIFSIIFMMGILTQVRAESTKEIVDLAGFQYDNNNNIYITKVNAKQRFFGYNRAYDYMSTILSMVIDVEPIIFKYQDKSYMIELWKGQYYASTGAEIGFYYQNELFNRQWECAHNEQMLTMSYTLQKKGVDVFSRTGVHWWLTGFKPGTFSQPNELSMENIRIEFKENGMGEVFYNALKEYVSSSQNADKYQIQFIPPNTVGFRWDVPIFPQDHLEKRKYYQDANFLSATAIYTTMHPDYSPENFDKKLWLLRMILKNETLTIAELLGFKQK